MSHLELTLTVFYIVFFVMLVFSASYWCLSNNKIERIEQRSIFLDIRFWIPCLVYTILLGYRWNYAYDWEQYYYTFLDIQKGYLYRDTTEKGYLAINYLLGRCGFDFYSIFLLEGFIYITSIYTMLQKNRMALAFALPLIYISARYNCLNISRQFFAQSILWIAFYYLIHNKKIIYFILGFIACTIHTSAYIWFVAFYVVRYFKMPSLKITSIIYCLCVSLKLVIQKYLFTLSSLLTAFLITNKGYDSEHMMADRFNRGELSVYSIFILAIIHFTFIFSAYYVRRKGYLKTDWENILVLIGIYGIFMNVLGGTHEILDRFFWYFSYLYYIAWGIVVCHMIKHFYSIPTVIWLLTFISFAQRLWFMYSTIVEECLGQSHHYLEYKINFIF